MHVGPIIHSHLGVVHGINSTKAIDAANRTEGRLRTPMPPFRSTAPSASIEEMKNFLTAHD